MPKAKKSNASPTNASKPAPGGPDDALILHCISFAQNVAALHATFKADPTDSEYAGKAAERLERASERTLMEAAAIPATTFVGLNAKARIVPLILEDQPGNYTSDEAEAFLRSFAADVKAFTDNLAAEARVAERAATRSNREAA